MGRGTPARSRESGQGGPGPPHPGQAQACPPLGGGFARRNEEQSARCADRSWATAIIVLSGEKKRKHVGAGGAEAGTRRGRDGTNRLFQSGAKPSPRGPAGAGTPAEAERGRKTIPS